MNEGFKNCIETETVIQVDSFQKYKSVDFYLFRAYRTKEGKWKIGQEEQLRKKSRLSRSTSPSAP